MKPINLFLLMEVLSLMAYFMNNQEINIVIKFTDSETERVKLAQADLSFDEFNDAIEKFNQEMAKVNGTEVEDHFKGATYDAYLLTRAKLLEENFEKAKAQEIFALELTYDDYKSISDLFINRNEYNEKMNKKETGNYGAYAAKVIQYITPEGSPNKQLGDLK